MIPDAFIIARITDTQGSTPRESGAYMLIAADTTLGSIGGGKLEQQAMLAARVLLAKGAFTVPHTQEFTLGTTLGQCCGGRVRVCYEYCTDTTQWQHPNDKDAAHFPIILFGAGHVGQALAAILATQHCRLHWVDSREAQFPRTLAQNTQTYPCATPPSLISTLPDNAYILVMTHDHALDLALCDAVLRHNRFRFLGLIGSQTKYTKFRKHLLENGHDNATVERITCPIGIPNLHSKQPERIALAVAAQLLLLHEQENLS